MAAIVMVAVVVGDDGGNVSDVVGTTMSVLFLKILKIKFFSRFQELVPRPVSIFDRTIPCWPVLTIKKSKKKKSYPTAEKKENQAVLDRTGAVPHRTGPNCIVSDGLG